MTSTDHIEQFEQTINDGDTEKVRELLTQTDVLACINQRLS